MIRPTCLLRLGHLRGETGFDLRWAHAAVTRETCPPGILVNDHHGDGIAKVLGTCLKEQWDIQNDEGFTGMLREEFQFAGADSWVDDFLKRSARLGVREDPRGEGTSVERTIREQHARTELPMDFLEGWGPLRHDFPGEFIGAYDLRPEVP